MQMGDIELLCMQIDLIRGELARTGLATHHQFVFFTAADFISQESANWLENACQEGFMIPLNAPQPNDSRTAQEIVHQ